jgi:L-threonylcarbamoyladenylate synthase
MKTAIFKENTLAEAARLLKEGEVVAFPTETVYGLGAAIFNPFAIQKIFTAKRRPSDNPLIAHLSHLDQVKELAVDIPKEFHLLAEAFFPGPLTVVLKRHSKVPGVVSGGLPTIALRMPRHALARELISLVGQPLVAPSANLSGRPSSTTAAHVLEDFMGGIAGVVDGGATAIGLESTVVSLLNPKQPMLLRPGSIAKEQIEHVLGKPLFKASEDAEEMKLSPGTRYRHYAPRMPLKLFTDWEAMQSYLQATPRCKRLVLSNRVLHGKHLTLTPESLYASLRFADQREMDEIIAFCDEGVLSNPALMDRLTRAASS